MFVILALIQNNTHAILEVIYCLSNVVQWFQSWMYRGWLDVAISQRL